MILYGFWLNPRVSPMTSGQWEYTLFSSLIGYSPWRLSVLRYLRSGPFFWQTSLAGPAVRNSKLYQPLKRFVSICWCAANRFWRNVYWGDKWIFALPMFQLPVLSDCCAILNHSATIILRRRIHGKASQSYFESFPLNTSVRKCID
jgi:hypothetical protein